MVGGTCWHPHAEDLATPAALTPASCWCAFKLNRGQQAGLLYVELATMGLSDVQTKAAPSWPDLGKVVLSTVPLNTKPDELYGLASRGGTYTRRDQ